MLLFFLFSHTHPLSLCLILSHSLSYHRFFLLGVVTSLSQIGSPMRAAPRTYRTPHY